MREEPEQARKNNRASGKKHDEKRLVSLLWSCFTTSNDDKSERNTRDEILKPLYYIVGDVNSEQMEETVESMDEDSIDKKPMTDKSFVRSLTPRVIFLFRLFRGLRGRSRRIENVSLGLATRMNAAESDDGTMEGWPDNSEKKVRKSSVQTHRLLRLLFLPRSANKQDTPTTKITQTTPVGLETDDENTESDDALPLRPVALGVTFAHPVYTGKCRFLMEDAKLDTTNHLWANMKRNQLETTVSVNEYDFPPKKTIVETKTAESWESLDSPSLYPTDEQSRESNVYYGSFDSDIDIPFDEIFTDANFFDV